MEEITTTEETILREMSESSQQQYSYTIDQYLNGSTNIDVPTEAIFKILIDRDIEPGTPVSDVEKNIRNLCVADLFVWICYGASRKGTISDTDNGWNHSNGGYTLSTYDKNLLLKQANAIYEENEEDQVGKTKVKITSFGIKRADITEFNTNKERYIR